MPQFLVNTFAEAISAGEIRAALIAGGEAMRTQHGVERAGLAISWRGRSGGEPELIGDPRRGWSDYEDRHQMRAAIVMYPLIENAIRGARGASVAGAHAVDGAAVLRDSPPWRRRNPLADPAGGLHCGDGSRR